MKKKVSEETAILSKDPFLAGRTEAAERYGHLARNAAQWRFISLIFIFLCIVCVFMIIRVSATRTVVPYIVQVDSHGYEIAIAPVAPSSIDARLVMARIARYVQSLKTVYSDTHAQTDLMNFIHQTTPANTPAETRYREFYLNNNPMEIAKTYSVYVTVNTILPLSESKWQCEWTEQGLDIRNGVEIFRREYRGIFDIAINTPTSMQGIMANPLGIFIIDFNFSEINRF